MRRAARRLLIGAAAAPIAAVGVLAVEVQLARMAPNLADEAPFDLDGRIRPDDGRRRLRMVWLGDSTAAGLGASSADQSVPRLVAAGLDRPVDLTSLAVSGSRIADVAAEQLARVASLRPDVVLISVGANDVTGLTSRSEFRREYVRVVEAMPSDATLVILGVPDMGAPPRLAQPLRAVAGHRGRQLDGVAAAVAREAGALYVDIAGETGPTMRSDTRRYFAADRYHPSDDGYALWADAVLAVIQPAGVAAEQEVVGADR